MTRDLRPAGEAPKDRAIRFTRSQPRRWLGNGMGVEPAHYDVLRRGLKIGTIRPRASYGWLAEIAGSRFESERLADLKRKVIVSCRTMP